MCKDMKETLLTDRTIEADNLIAYAYSDYHELIIHYIRKRINHPEDAEDIAQDVFVRLLDYKQMLLPSSIKSFIFTIASNLVIDYIRRYYRKQEVSANMFEFYKEFECNIESNIHTKEIFNIELQILQQQPEKRRKIYELSRFDEITTADIAEQLQLSKRTVESHLYQSRKQMRNLLKKCI